MDASLGISYGLIIVAAPLLGAYADAYAAKKRLLLLMPSDAFHLPLCFILSGPAIYGWRLCYCSVKFFFRMRRKSDCRVFAGAGAGRALGKVSGWGWSLGYIGGLVSLGVSLAYVTWAQE